MKNNQSTDVGDFLRKKRETKKLKQVDVSRKIGINPSVLCRYEKNQTRPSLEKINDLIEAYQLTKEEEGEFREILSLRELRFQKTPREFQILTQLLMLPKSIRKQIIEAAVAYDSASESSNGK